MHRLLVCRLAFCICLIVHPATVRAVDVWRAVAEGLSYDVRALGFGTLQQAAESSQNPHNAFLQLPRYAAELSFRPDIRLTLGRLEGSVKPRLRLTWQADAQGTDDTEADVFVQEWLARVRLREDLFLSYGRENVQWGPAFLTSPSNPLVQDNGRLNPKREVPSAEIARLVWRPASAWTLSALAKVGAGRQEPREFAAQKTYALKLDYTGPAAYASLIASYQEADRFRLSWFGGWTVSDALLLYTEGTLAQGSNARYPLPQAQHPFGATLAATRAHAAALTSSLLLGGSYTLDFGPTLSVEYLYHSAGYRPGQARTYYQLRQRAADALLQPGPLRDLGRQTLRQTLDTGLRGLRQHYLLVQCVHNNLLHDTLNLTVRWRQNLDDASGQGSYVLEYFLGSRTQLFTVGVVHAGGERTEFGSLVRYQIMFGLQVTW